MDELEMVKMISEMARKVGTYEGLFLCLQMFFKPHTIETIKELVHENCTALEAMEVLDRILTETIIKSAYPMENAP